MRVNISIKEDLLKDLDFLCKVNHISRSALISVLCTTVDNVYSLESAYFSSKDILNNK